MCVLHSSIVMGYLLFLVLEMPGPSPQLTSSTVCVSVSILVTTAQCICKCVASTWCPDASPRDGGLPLLMTQVLINCLSLTRKHTTTRFLAPTMPAVSGSACHGMGESGRNRGSNEGGEDCVVRGFESHWVLVRLYISSSRQDHHSRSQGCDSPQGGGVQRASVASGSMRLLCLGSSPL